MDKVITTDYPECPFCGSNEIDRDEVDWTIGGIQHIFCTECGAEGETIHGSEEYDWWKE